MAAPVTASTGHQGLLPRRRCFMVPDSFDGVWWWAAVGADHPRVVGGHVTVAGEAGVAGSVSTVAGSPAHLVPLR